MANMDHYPYRVRWSAEDQAYVGTGAELPSLSGLADTQEDAFSGIRELVTNVLDDMDSNGEPRPEAISDRSYSGKFMMRITPEAHRQLVLDAAEQQVSLNRLVANRLTSA